MASQQPIAYLPFEELMGKNADRIFNALETTKRDLVGIKSSNQIQDLVEHPPEFLLVVLGRMRSPDKMGIGNKHFPILSSLQSQEVVCKDDKQIILDTLEFSVASGIKHLVVVIDGTEVEFSPNTVRVENYVPFQDLAKSPNTVDVNSVDSEEIFDDVVKGIREVMTLTPEAEPSAGNEPREESIAQSALSDQATSTDLLGFKVYVEAIAAFLTSKETKGPFAMSIEGEWGSGKSSFMLNLKQELENENHSTVWFNAWRHDQEESMWAAFALTFVGELSQKLKEKSCWRRFKASWRLFARRFDWSGGWKDIAKTVFSLVLWVLVIIAVWKYGAVPFKEANGNSFATLDILLGLGASLVGLRAVIKLIRDTTEIVGNPLRFDLKKHVKSEDYAGRISFIERFHNDFTKIIDAYVGEDVDKNVFVFVDDLDRCEVPKAAELMQAMNLMIGDDARLVFIIGMDREKVAAGLAVKYKDLLPYIHVGRREYNEETKGRMGTRFGHAFIEKFIQLPFRVPVPGEPELKAFLNRLNGQTLPVGKTEEKTATSKAVAPTSSPKTTEETLAGGSPAATDREGEKGKLESKVATDSPVVHEAVLMVADVFDYNPRRIKQFLNCFRLKAYIASRTGLLSLISHTTTNGELTLEQLAKFVAISLRWPLLLADLDEDRELLQRLSAFAENPDRANGMGFPKPDDLPIPTPAEKNWRNEKYLLQFLIKSAGEEERKNNPDTYAAHTMTTLNVKGLLEISPVVSSSGGDSSGGSEAA